MNLAVTITSPELAEALNNLADAIRGRTGAFVPVTEADKAEPEKPKAAAKSAAKPKTTQPTPEPETDTGAGEKETDQQQPASDESETGSDIDYAQVKAAVMKVSTTKGRQAAVDLLGEFDAKVGGDLTEEQWGPFLARAEEVLA